MAQTWRASRRSARSGRRPLDERSLEERAIAYVGRYATTRARVADFLRRKIAERGWAGDSPPQIEALIERLAALGYVDDAAFAAARAAGLRRRGYGERRVDAALRAAGIDEAVRNEVGERDDEAQLRAALALARRRRLGPFGDQPLGRDARQRAMATLLRAGHEVEVARRVLAMTAEEAADAG